VGVGGHLGNEEVVVLVERHRHRIDDIRLTGDQLDLESFGDLEGGPFLARRQRPLAGETGYPLVVSSGADSEQQDAATEAAARGEPAYPAHDEPSSHRENDRIEGSVAEGLGGRNEAAFPSCKPVVVPLFLPPPLGGEGRKNHPQLGDAMAFPSPVRWHAGRARHRSFTDLLAPPSQRGTNLPSSKWAAHLPHFLLII